MSQHRARSYGVTGSVRSSREWSRIVEDWRKSGQITREFCRDRDLSLKTFQWWRWALEARGTRPHDRSNRGGSHLAPRKSAPVVTPLRSADSVPAFVEVIAQRREATLPQAVRRPRVSGVEIFVPGRRGERRIRVDVEFDVVTLRQVVSALEEE